ncbi:MAG: signal peptide peptidase SppA [Amoebophilaceae bacterium]|nr:signal peptide peptidase SppA [Amoebophilaceae bacterium]
MRIIRFIKQVFTVAIGCMVSFFILMPMVGILFVSLSKLASKKLPYKPRENTILELKLMGNIVETVPVSLFDDKKGQSDLKVIKKVIHEATADQHIKALYIDISHMNANWAVLAEIRSALLAFKKMEKLIVAYGDCYSQKSYYLASLADEIVLNPSGYFAFQGLSATIQFYTNLLNKIAVKPVIFRIGDYKTFVEPFSLHEMSKESRQQTRSYLDYIYEHFLSQIGLARNISIPKLREYANNLSAVLPEDVLQAGLITKIGYKEETKELLKDQICKTIKDKDKDKDKEVQYATYDSYYASIKQASDAVDKVALVIVEGEIIDGSSKPGYVGANDFVNTLKTIQRNDAVKAVVLRINSPGGSVLASDAMWYAIESLKKVKPVVASMSGVAASGGYYIAAPCHYIFAQPTTLTGSIGIFGLWFDTSELMQKIGIEQDVVKTAPSADFLNPRTSCLESESRLMFKILGSNYDTFLDKVSAGRGLTIDQVRKVASGRVFAGIEAAKNGLIDELGGLEVAIEKAATLAKLNGKYTTYYMPSKTKFQELLDLFVGNLKTKLWTILFREESFLFQQIQGMQVMHKKKGMQVMLPYKIEVN